MKEALEFLKKASTFYLATVEGDQPHVRPFGAVCEFKGKLYIVTNNTKDVYKQMAANPKIEISGMAGGKWIRLKAEAVRDDRFEARKAMLDANPSLRNMYNEDDGKVEVLYLQNATATICSFSDAPVTYTF
ncbi:MAG: pyridoxamine 5'-phosphate oxidase family protein [Oscillospiraceae bacterium]|nr:pyridoxamine 5'-phosphate oxidase family protein [Oscillospiraceae bacterium]